MSDTVEQFNSQSRWKKFVTSPWGRIVVGLALVALVALVAYFVLGLVSGGEARLSLSPATGNYYQGEQIRVSVMLSGTTQRVTAAAAYVRYDSRFLFIENLTRDVRLGNAWNAATASLARVNDVQIQQDPNAPSFNEQDPNAVVREVEVVGGQPSPGLVASGLGVFMQIAEITFRVRNSFPAGYDSINTPVRLDTYLESASRSMVIIDDARGIDILGSGRDAAYSLFRAPVDTSCTTVHPGAFVCGQNEFCPGTPYSDVPGSTCCPVQCIRGQRLEIIEGSINPQIIRNEQEQVTQVIIRWRTNLLSDSRVFDIRSVDQQGGQQTFPQQSLSDNVTDHAVTLPNSIGWVEGRLYYYRVGSTWTDPNPFCLQGVNPFCTSEATSKEHSFTIQTEQVRRLQIFDLAARGVSNTSAVISWTTNYPAVTSQIIYTIPGGANADFNFSEQPSTIHSVRLTGLRRNTFYRFSFTATAAQSTGLLGDYDDEAKGSFTTLNLTTEPDANVILKVEQDRTCENWLTCTSSLKVKNKQKKIEDMCFALGECDTLDPTTGKCLKVKSDTPVNRFTTVYNSGLNSTIDLAKNLSGYSKPELELRGFGTSGFEDTTLKGFSSFGTLRQYGSSVTVVNGTFDQGIGFYPWTSHPSNTASLDTVFDDEAGGNVLAVASSTAPSPTWGAKISLGKNSVAKQLPYFVSFSVRADLKPDTSSSEIKVQFGYQGYSFFNAPNSTYRVPVTPGWQQVVVGPFIPPANIGDLGEVFLGLLVTSDIDMSQQPKQFFVDNVLIQPVLGAGSGLYIPRVCRAYPSSSAPTCDYFDPFSGKAFRGWKGYCLVPDPKDSTGKDCLQWWPVDVISGSASSFSSDRQAGYLADGGRFPLYYCLEAEGNYPYHMLFNKFELINPFSPDYNSCLMTSLGGVTFKSVCNVESQLEKEQFPASFEPWLRVPKSSIAYIEIPWNSGDPDHTFILTEANNWSAWRVNGADCPAVNSWDEFDKYATDNGVCQGIPNDNCDMNGIRFEFDEKSELLKRISYGGCDDSPKTGFTQLKSINYYRREVCTVVTQVVDPFGRNAAQTARVSSKTYKVPGVQYEYGTDYKPFGAVVHPNPDFDPSGIVNTPETEWKKLQIEPPSAEVFSQEPYQVRGGAPYSLRTPGERVTGYCKNYPLKSCNYGESDVNVRNEPCQSVPTDQCIVRSYEDRCNPQFDPSCGGGTTIVDYSYCENTGVAGCNTDDDCNDPTDKICVANIQVGGIGPKTCISGSRRGATCTNNADCGFDDSGGSGICTGADKPKEFTDYMSFAQELRRNPASKLANLFAKTYGTWQWIRGKYEKICSEGEAPVCVGGPNPGISCQLNSDCGTGGGCGYHAFRCSTNTSQACSKDSDCGGGTCSLIGAGSCKDPVTTRSYSWDATKGGLGVKPTAPQVKNVRVNDKTTVVEGNGNLPVELSFTSHVDANQLPLVRYTVDWGDGEITSEGDLSIAPKSSDKDPHRLGHVYRYFDPDTPHPFGCTPGVNCERRVDGTDATYGSKTLCTSTGCNYRIRIQIQDNWEWCNNSTNNNQCGLSSSSAWTSFGQAITVTP